MSSKSELVSLLGEYFEQDPSLAALKLQGVTEKRAAAILSELPLDIATEIFSRFRAEFAAAVVAQLKPERLSEMASQTGAELCATIALSLLPERRPDFLKSLPDKLRLETEEFLLFPEESAGRIMKTDYMAFFADLRVKDVIQKIRAQVKKRGDPSYVYVVDEENHLLGVINMRDMLLASSNDLLREVMRPEVLSINAFDGIEQVTEIFSARQFFSLPVVDAQNRLVGIVRSKHVLGSVQEEAARDIQQMVGVGRNERAFSPISFCMQKRLPWLHVNLLSAFLAAGVVAVFEDMIARFTVLAIYLPVVAGQGGNAGAQSLAVVMRGLVMREIPTNKVRQLIVKETIIGLLNGLVIGVVTGLVAWYWQGNPTLGLVIALAMLVNLAAAGLSGAAIPVLMKAIGLDPAQSSSIVLTTVTDVVGFFAFLGFAVVFQNHLN